MTDAQFVLALVIIAPMALIVVVGMFRGYHIWLHIYKAPKGEEKSDGQSSP